MSSKAQESNTTMTTTGPKLKKILARMSAVTSTLTGLDGAIMLAQYSSPLVIALLLRLARYRKDGGKGLRGVAEGIARGAGGMGEARTVMRAFGILPIIQWILALHPRPIAALKQLLFAPHRVAAQALESGKTIPTIQALALMVYYPLEHLGWLGGKGIVPMAGDRVGKAVLWSVRAWAVYVMLDIYKLQSQYLSLRERTRSLRSNAKAKAQLSVSQGEAEGYELQEKSDSNSTTATTGTTAGTGSVVGISTAAGPPKYEVSADVAGLRKEWRVWQLASLKNVGYGPLTVHWGAGPVWASPLITSVLGCVSASAKLLEEWEKTA